MRQQNQILKMLMVGWQLFLDKDTDSVLENGNCSVAFGGFFPSWMCWIQSCLLVTRVILVKLFLPCGLFSSASSDRRHQKQEQKLFNHSDRTPFFGW